MSNEEKILEMLETVGSKSRVEQLEDDRSENRNKDADTGGS